MKAEGANVGALPVRGRLWQRAAQAGFWFFLLKGLAWLALPVIMATTGVSCGSG